MTLRSSDAPTQDLGIPDAHRSPLVYLLEEDIAVVTDLAAHGYQVQTIPSADGLLAAYAAGERPDVVVMALHLSNERVLVEIRSHDTCLVFIVQDDMAEQVMALRKGACNYLTRPLGAQKLTPLLDNLTHRPPVPPYRVLLIACDDLAAKALQSAGITVHVSLDDPVAALGAVEHFAPDVVLIDLDEPEAKGPALAAILRERDAQIPILLSSDDSAYQQTAHRLDCDALLLKPLPFDQLTAIVAARAKSSRQMKTALTRLTNTLYEREREHMALNQHAIVSIADRRGNITYVNDKFSEISGYTRDELLGHNHRLLKSFKHPPEFYRDLWSTIAGGKLWQGEICNRRRDGSLYWVESTITPFMDSSGKPYQYVSIRTDITHVKAAEIALEHHKERLRRGQHFANIGTWDWNILTGELYWTERIAPLFGYPAGDLETSYENFLAAIHPDDRESVVNAVNACIERNVPYEVEHRVVWPDGTVRWLLEKGAVVRDEAGKPIQMLGVVQDIDERKQIEAAFIERDMQLQEAQRLAHIGNWSADLVTGELAWSDEIYRIFGHKPGSFQPSVSVFQNAVHPEDREKVRESEMRSAKTGLHDLVHRIVRPDGTVRHVHELARAITDAQGKLLGLIGTVQDVTTQMEDEEALITTRDEADRANQAKSEFLSSMSHELRTPMNAILGFAQLLQYDEKLSEENMDSVHEILKAGEHLLTLINEVLDLAKIESGHIDLSLEPVEVCPVVEECLSLVRTLADKRGIKLSHAGLAGIAVRADRMRLKQALLNLLSNAIKYNNEDGSVRIEVHPRTDDRLHIRVTDTGPGISEARQAELFEPFNRLDAASSIEGTGIGLTITRRIVEMMGGTVEVESKHGEGRTFWIALPIATMADQKKQGQPAIQNIAPAHGLLHTVLYIEDNPSNLKLVAQLLGQRKHIHMLTTHLPELGIELAKSRKPDLILLDINMPGMNGYELLKALKADGNLKDIPVIALTANAMPRDAARVIAAGFSAYLTKPINVAEFFGTVDRYLSGDA